MRLLQECKSKVKENPIDAQYKSLKCDLDILDKKSSDYQVSRLFLKLDGVSNLATFFAILESMNCQIDVHCKGFSSVLKNLDRKYLT